MSNIGHRRKTNVLLVGLLSCKTNRNAIWGGTMDCWICNEKGTSGEHLVKASDLRYYFGKITTKEPLYFNREGRCSKMQSAVSTYVKAEALICSSCNNSLSQPYDKAWENLSCYLQENFQNLKNNKRIKISNAFRFNSNAQLLNVHLYFVKLFGCRLASESTPIDISSFSKSIKESIAHPQIFISIGWWEPKIRNVGISDIEAIEAKGKTVVAYWFYVVGKIAVCVTYCENLDKKNLLEHCWHPHDVKKYIDFVHQDI